MLYNECLWMCTNYVTFCKKRPTVLVSRPSNLYFLALLARVWRKVCSKSKATKNEVAFNSGNFKVLLTFLQCIYATTRPLANLCWLHNVASCWVCSSAFFRLDLFLLTYCPYPQEPEAPDASMAAQSEAQAETPAVQEPPAEAWKVMSGRKRSTRIVLKIVRWFDIESHWY